MARFPEQPFSDLEAQMRRDDPRFAHALETGRPYRPRKYRHGSAWLLLAISLTTFIAGVVAGQGLLIAAGLVLAGVAGHLLDRRQPFARRRVHPRKL
ncbi:hypothetical protein TH66_17180 [Carbonactinospora thermoautotrophica]|uniref:Putative membrane protein n=1 Tax=Carbonactinospora thermoautotrophica TaxID=1469144 RepID=A0A132NEE0_9ACTN|nr:DUF3040 domain-containing protein [Carbonactinospora thermoautotrophica]KWX00488.1 hypothetical protein TH66_17180 [Carbonactinospora thermoautotrophica]KWX01447.1 putative membrane protein [Carbonactinospora thermoautotrophica]KWX08481.1 hypothetical protein TR74_14800 [Carbonactinospora thermoautotrophica]